MLFVQQSLGVRTNFIRNDDPFADLIRSLEENLERNATPAQSSRRCAATGRQKWRRNVTVQWPPLSLDFAAHPDSNLF